MLSASGPGRRRRRFPAPGQQAARALAGRVLREAAKAELRSDRLTPWEVMHATLPFGSRRLIYDAAARRHRPAIDWLLRSARWRGHHIFRAVSGGVAPVASASPLAVEDHPDQILLALARAGISRSAPIQIRNRRCRVEDLLRAACLAASEQREASFTLAALALYLGPGARWRNSRGEQLSLGSLVSWELRARLEERACGGTHLLFALALVLRARRRAGLPWSGEYREAAQRVRRHHRRALALQYPDGAFSAAFLSGRRRPADAAELLYSSGHTLEFLMLAASARAARSPAVRRAVALCSEQLRSPGAAALPRGALDHALAALRMFLLRTAIP